MNGLLGNYWPLKLKNKERTMLKKVLVLSLFGWLLITQASQAVTLQSMTPILAGQYNIYAPTVLGNKLWVGGWKTASQTEDAIYISQLTGSTWSQPTLVFNKPGWLINDPTIIQPPSTDGVDRTNWLYMYYTALKDPLLYCTAASYPSGQGVNTCEPNYIQKNNLVGLATSVNGGVTWTDIGIIINKDNGLNSCGAWAPSAVVDDTNVLLYFHGSTIDCPKAIYRYVLNPNGWQVLGKGTLSLPAALPADRTLVNVDVQKVKKGSYVMLANHVGNNAGGAPYLGAIYRYTSEDGITFKVPSDNSSDAPMVSSSTQFVLTPHAQVTNLTSGGSYTLNVWFGITPDRNNLANSKEIHKWSWSATATP